MKVTLAFGVLVVLTPTSTLAGPVFLGLGDLPGGTAFSRAQGVSADGTTVVGASRSAQGLEAFRWTFEGGMIGLGDLPGGEFRSEAFDVSSNGSVVVGNGRPGNIGTNEGFRWTPSAMVGLGSLAGGTLNSFASGISANGNVIVGEAGSANGTQAYRWTFDSGMVGLGDLPGGDFESRATDVAADGFVIVGVSQTGNGDGEAFRWTAEAGMIGLGFLPGGGESSLALAISGDGDVIVGRSDSVMGGQTFRWTEETGMEAIADFIPLAMSYDGSLIVGELLPFSRAVVWDEMHGLRDLRELLETDFAFDLTGWELGSARGISADGTVIVGQGVNPLGNGEAWMAVIPEPSSTILLLAGILTLTVKRHRSVNARESSEEERRGQGDKLVQVGR